MASSQSEPTLSDQRPGGEERPIRASKILVPIGLHHDAERIMPIAADVAQTLDAPLEMVHVVPVIDPEVQLARRREWMKPLADRFDAKLRLVEHQSVSIALRDVMADQPNAVVCMDVDASGGPADTVYGSISEDVLRAGHHRCVLLGPNVGGSPSIAVGPVVVCVDGSDHSESILPDAAAWIAETGSSAWVVLVASDSPLPADIDEASYVRRVAMDLGVRDPEWEVLHGHDHAQSIVDFADGREAGSIVMATHGRSGLGRLAWGSTTMRVVHRASCPVLARRPPVLSAIVN